MTYNENLTKVVQDMKFKTFWHCFDYLILAGHNQLDVLGIALKEFGEEIIFSNVAFAEYKNLRTIDERGNYMAENNFYSNPNVIEDKKILTIGLIDETNIHLSGLYSTYRKWMMEDRFVGPQNDIENTCELIRLNNLNTFVIDFIHEVSIKHFGCEIFKLTPVRERVSDVDLQSSLDSFREAMNYRQDPTIQTGRINRNNF